jgi:MFS family permease
MERLQAIRTRIYSFVIAACMDGMLGFVILATPLFAIRLGADAWQLGALGWVAQLIRVPFTLYSGRLSDRIGRTRVIYPSALIGLAGCVGLVLSTSYVQVLIWYTCVMIAMGGFYPALMAFIGDRSPQGELRRNLSFFNAGWASSCSVCGLAVGVMLPRGVWTPFAAGAVLVGLAGLLVVVWSRLHCTNAPAPAADTEPQPVPSSPGVLLIIARIGLGLTVAGFAIVTSLFPKLGSQLLMSESRISIVVGMLLIGQAAGILACSAGPWWRGKLWPHLASQGMSLAAGLVVVLTRSEILFGAAFLVLGVGIGITYSAALYYGLQARLEMGKNTGIHESMIAVASVVGNLVGGATAQAFSLRTPYLVLAALSGAALAVSLAFWTLRNKR